MITIDGNALIKKAYDEAKGMAEPYDDFGVLVEWLVDKTPPIEPEPQWIPVSERLPKIGIDVLFTVKVNGCKWVAEGCHRVDGRWWHYFMNRALEYDKVTAWMPLPEPYKKGAQDG